MPYQTEWKKRGVIWTYWGEVTGEELIRSNTEIYGSPRFDDIDYQIVDLSGVEKNQISESDMRRIAHLDRAAARSNRRIRVAVIAGEAAGIRETDIYEKHVDGFPWDVAVFKDIEHARQWLGLDGSGDQ